MKNRLLQTVLVLILVGGAGSIAGCSQSDSGATPGESASTETSVASDPAAAAPTILDVRSPEEYEAGHLENAILLDLNSGQFEETLPTLDPDAEYAVYCRSGNRSGQAVALMENAGFTKVQDLGPMEAASSTLDTPIVTD